MTRLQGLTLLRDAVAQTKGVYAGLWYDGPNRHCTIGAVTQVAIDCGFDEQTAKGMMARVRTELGTALENRIVAITDSPRYAHLTPEKRRERILGLLDNAIAKETEHAPAVPDSPKGLTDAVLETVGVNPVHGIGGGREPVEAERVGV